MLKYLVASLAALGPLQAQHVPHVVVLHVSESAGIRRTTYPVNARVPFARGTMDDASHVRLVLKGAEVPAQIQAETRWPDGSVQWLDVDFNASIGPIETADYAVEYGPTVSALAPPRGLTVTDGPGTIQVGNVTFGKNASPLIRSVKYRDEDIGKGANGISFVDTVPRAGAGAEHDLVMDGATVKVVKPGPLYVALEYSGQVTVDATHRATAALSVEMPNSKTWVKISATIPDPDHRIQSIALHTPLALGAYPWLWDFGTAKGTYGVFRAATDRATLTQSMGADGEAHDWRTDLAAGGRPPQVSEVGSNSAGTRWGQIQDGKEVIAFAFEPPAQIAVSTIDLDGTGELALRVTRTPTASELHITAYEHFVASPVQVGAATTPAAMLSPLSAVCDGTQYASSGVQAPSGVR